MAKFQTFFFHVTVGWHSWMTLPVSCSQICNKPGAHITQEALAVRFICHLWRPWRGTKDLSLSFSSLTVGNNRVLISWASATWDKNPINVNLPDPREVAVWLSGAYEPLDRPTATSSSRISWLEQQLDFIPNLNISLPFFFACSTQFHISCQMQQ